MADLTMIQLHLSPYSERLRWALEWKRLPYQRQEYQPVAGEEELRRSTGISTVPVLLADGRVIGDSNAALDWLEREHPDPALLPADARERTQVRAVELAATESITPLARLIMIGRYKALDLQPLADHFASKYGWSAESQGRAESVLRSFLPELAHAVEKSPYLVGERFTRADLTVACMLAAVIGPPPDDLFVLDPGMRTMLGVPLAESESWGGTLRQWRDGIYRRHRGGCVVA